MSAITYATFQKDFRIQKRLGKGNCSTVSQVYHYVDKRYYALKITQLSSLEELTQAFNQIETIKTIDDDQIAKIYFYYSRENKRTGKLELGLIMELCGSNLSDIIKNRKNKNQFFTLTQLRVFLGQLIPFFAKMQKKGYVHRDIKPDNILLSCNSKSIYRVADFGFAIRLSVYSTQNIAGTMQYVSPKLLVKFRDNKLCVPGHNVKDDVYSFGKTLFQFMTLQINPSNYSKKMTECLIRYGPEYHTLIMLMMKEDQIERPDFVYLQNYLKINNLIKQSVQIMTKDSFAGNVATKRDKQDKTERTSTSNNSKNKKLSASRTKEKGNDYTKTRRKDVADGVSIESIKENKLKLSKVNLKASKIKQQKIRTQVTFGEQIWAMTTCENLLFLGLQGKLGIMLITTDKLIKLVFSRYSKEITCLKYDSQHKFIILGSLDKKFYIISINEIKKLIIDFNDHFKKKNQLELPIETIKYKQITLKSSVSSFDFYYESETSKQPTLILGHYTGEITINNCTTEISSLGFSNETVTCIAYRQGYIYTARASGQFKKQSALACGIYSDEKNQKRQISRASLCQKNKFYKCSDSVIAFEIIDKCSANKNIVKEEHKYLAILISYDGFLHIISNAMICEQLIRISHSPLQVGFFEVLPNSSWGVKCHLVNEDGIIYDEKGSIEEITNQKQVSCMWVLDTHFYLGSYNKMMKMIARKQTIKID